MKLLTRLLLLLTAANGYVATVADPVKLRDIMGAYHFGDGLGVNCDLTVTEKGRFTFEWRGCMGIYDSNQGGASANGAILQLTPEKPNVRKGFRGTPTAFYPVRWGNRMYLVATNEMAEFCSAFNQRDDLGSPVRGDYYLRQDAANKVMTGKPAVPKEWQAYLLDRPVRGKITQLIGKQEAWLDKGSDDGLLVGMILMAQRHNKLMFARVQIEAVEKGRCRIKCCWDDSQLALEQKVTTRFID